MSAGPTKVMISGWKACPFTVRAVELARSLSALFPGMVLFEDQVTADRNAYTAWRESNAASWGPKAAVHRSAPFCVINNEFLGGCDDFLAWTKTNFLSGGQSKVGLNGVSKAITDDLVIDHPYEYDVICIGGGSGGLAVSKECANLLADVNGAKAKVGCLDFVKPSPQGTTWGLGGTCVNVGCIPKKLMHNASLMAESFTDMKYFGLTDGTKPSHSWDTMLDNINNMIRGIQFKSRVALRDGGVTYLNKLGKFIDAHTLELTDKKGNKSTVTSQRFVVAVGGRPSNLSCPGAEHVITSDDIFWKQTPPGKTCVIGAGYVALECAGFMNGLGYDVTVAVRSILLRGFDREMADKIGELYEAHGIKLLKKVTPSSIEKLEDGKLKVTFSNGETDVFDTVLNATGRYADTADLGLESAGVEINEKNGKIKCVNEQTTAPHIYAIGDVVDLPNSKLELTPVAIQAGIQLARRLYGGSDEPMDYDSVATTFFTLQEYGCVGMSEDEAIEKYGEEFIEVYASEFMPLEWSLTAERAAHPSYCKVVCHKGLDEKILGMHILGPNCGEIIQGYAVAVKKGITYKELYNTVGIHPTVAEEFTTLTITKGSGQDLSKGGC